MADLREARGLFLYRETVVSAPEAGTWCSGCVSGDPVAAGEAVGELKKLNDINTDPVAMVFSPVSGVYRDTLDGWEVIFQQGLSASLSLEEIFDRKETEKRKINDFVRQGEPCFKVITAKGNVDLLLASDDLHLDGDEISFVLYGKEYRAAVKKRLIQNGRHYTLVTLPNEAAFLRNRYVEPQILCGEKKGVVIGATAVFPRFGKTGVYCNHRGKIQYREIEILAQEEDNVLVSGVEAGECLVCRRR